MVVVQHCDVQPCGAGPLVFPRCLAPQKRAPTFLLSAALLQQRVQLWASCCAGCWGQSRGPAGGGWGRQHHGQPTNHPEPYVPHADVPGDLCPSTRHARTTGCGLQLAVEVMHAHHAAPAAAGEGVPDCSCLGGCAGVTHRAAHQVDAQLPAGVLVGPEVHIPVLHVLVLLQVDDGAHPVLLGQLPHL